MGYQKETDVFNENLSYINNVNYKIILLSNVITVLLFIFSFVGIFAVSKYYCLSLFIFSVTATIIDFLLTKVFKSCKKLASFFGLFALAGFITVAGTSKDIGIYMTFSLIPIVTSLYYDKKLTVIINLISYFFMLISLYFKWKNGATLFINSEGNTGFTATYLPIAIGFTIEYLVISLILYLLTIRNHSILTQMSTALRKINISHEQVKSQNRQLEDTQLKIIAFVGECLGSHDLYTGRHILHTKEYVSMICLKLREMKYYEPYLTYENIALFSSAAFLHDIGKIHIPEGILNKTGKFTNEEFERMKSHPAEGRKLLEFLPKIGDGKFNEIAIQMAYCHHEKWNGTGYPRRLSQTEIPLCARIMAAADVLDALISQRLYKEPMTIDEAMKVFEESKGTHFEPCIADAVIACREEIIAIDHKFKEAESAEYNEELEWWNSYHQNK